jgi:dTDP-4-amino-4,6-dideoxygalactose transaminase
MQAIHALAGRYGFRIVEDASHALGGRYQGAAIGGGRYSDITVFSFHPVKIVTTGEGGAAVTNHPGLAAHMRRLRSHGITRDRTEMTHEPDGAWYYQQVELGFNYRLTDLQAALCHSQLQRLDRFIGRRHELARRYDAALQAMPLVTPWQHPDTYSALHLYVIRLKLHEIRRTHREVFDALRAAGIGVNLHYIPGHRQPYYAGRAGASGGYPEADRYYADAISLPLFPLLADHEQDRVIGAVAEAVGA